MRPLKGKVISGSYDSLEQLRVDDLYCYFKANDLINETKVMIKVPKDEKGFRDLVYEWDYCKQLLKALKGQDDIILKPTCLFHDFNNHSVGYLATSYDGSFKSVYELKKKGVFRRTDEEARKEGSNRCITFEGKLTLMVKIAEAVERLHAAKYSHNNLDCWTILVNIDTFQVMLTGLSCITPFG